MTPSLTEPMHVCFLTQEYPPETGWGGIGAYTYDLAHGLAAAGHKVSVVSKAVDQNETQHTHDGVTVHRIAPKPDWARWPGLWRLNHVWPGFAWAARRKLAQINQESPIHIVEAPENRADSYRVRDKCPGPKYVVRLHTASRFINEINHVQPNLRWWLTYRQEARVLRQADLVTAPSRAVVDLTRRAYPLPEDVAIIPNPVDIARFKPTEEKTSPLLLYVGRLEAHKGAGTLATILPGLCQSVPGLNVRMAGHDTKDAGGRSWKAKILAQIPSEYHSRILWGAVDRHDLPAWYARAVVLVVPSYWENFPYVILESMACGTPVVASRVGGIPAIVENGQTGFLVSPDDPQGFEEKISSLLTDLPAARQMGMRARKQVKSQFSLEVIVPKMLALYQGLCADD